MCVCLCFVTDFRCASNAELKIWVDGFLVNSGVLQLKR